MFKEIVIKAFFEALFVKSYKWILSFFERKLVFFIIIALSAHVPLYIMAFGQYNKVQLLVKEIKRFRMRSMPLEYDQTYDSKGEIDPPLRAIETCAKENGYNIGTALVTFHYAKKDELYPPHQYMWCHNRTDRDKMNISKFGTNIPRNDGLSRLVFAEQRGAIIGNSLACRKWLLSDGALLDAKHPNLETFATNGCQDVVSKCALGVDPTHIALFTVQVAEYGYHSVFFFSYNGNEIFFDKDRKIANCLSEKIGVSFHSMSAFFEYVKEIVKKNPVFSDY